VSWSRLEAGAPELARLARARLEASGVALLGTLRRDGSPRISPVEPFFLEHELVLGVMVRSGKARDLRHDPRCVLHSTLSGPNAGEPDAKLYGRVEPSAAPGGWWADRPEDADAYRLVVEEAVTIEWELAASRMRVRRWTAAAGENVTERTYP
jgi:Pyridoxamine 5'-phosphate oxidase